jgi:copper chaperone
MKISDWIAENKIFIVVPLLALFVAVVFVLAYNSTGNANNADQTAEPSYPTPTIKTADDPVGGSPAVPGTEADTPVAAELKPDTAKVVFQVDGMSCSGCIATIKSSLDGYEGIRDIIVNISGGTAEVYYDSGQIQDLDRLAASITNSGYPARISQVMTADQLREEEAVSATRAKVYIASVGEWEATRAKVYIASVGEWDISRTDFDTELAYASNRYKKAYGPNVFADSRGKNVLDSIKAQVVSRLVNEGIQMQEVQRVGYRVDPKVFDQKFENRVLLRHYIENQVLNNAASDYDKQQQYLAWFNNARTLSKVTIYDKQLERLTQNQSAGGGCGSSCKS